MDNTFSNVWHPFMTYHICRRGQTCNCTMCSLAQGLRANPCPWMWDADMGLLIWQLRGAAIFYQKSQKQCTWTCFAARQGCTEGPDQCKQCVHAPVMRCVGILCQQSGREGPPLHDLVCKQKFLWLKCQPSGPGPQMIYS